MASVILGYGCRLPGANDPEGLWSLLAEGRCAIAPVPPGRWSARTHLHPDRAAAGRTYVAAAGLVDRPLDFDAEFFGVSPREAMQMDPQQRLLLMAAWDAIDMAGLGWARLAGPRAGVFVGVSGLDYGDSLAGDPAAADSRFMTGNTLSIVANRLAHFLDAQGPSYVVDTACSSALFALDAARRAIAAGEIDVAVVGGVNLLWNPMPFVGFSRAAMLSPGGLCKAFDHRADGYVRAEGAVAVVIASEPWARAAGDRVRGRLLWTEVNSDGRANTLSVPNWRRQADLMGAALAGAGLTPDDLGFVEAHGTGTAVGDPMEAQAIGTALAQGRAAPLPIGSIKSNIGHLEPAAGLAGLLKAQLALEHGLLPATLHVEKPNPAIPFDDLNLRVAAEPLRLPDGALAAAVNAFGFGGANACAILARPDPAPPAEAPPAAPAPLILTAATAEALRAQAARWGAALAADPAAAPDLIDAAARRRARHARRAVFAPADPAALVAALGRFAAGESSGPWAVDAAPRAGGGRVAFLFSGNGAQWAGMGRAAHAEDPAFRTAFDAAAVAVAAEGGEDPRRLMHAGDLEDRLAEAGVAQPLMLAFQVGMVAALAARGLRADMVCGHSVGEVAAAWACGALTLEQAARLSVRRAAAQAPLQGTGGMAAVLAGAEAAQALVEAVGDPDLTVAADNSPRGVTVSGPVAAIEALAALARKRRVAVRKLSVAFPFHGPLMAPIEAALAEALADLRPGPARIPFFSTALGVETDGRALDAGYWWANARRPVLFRQAVEAMAAAGAGVFVEIGPQPALQNYVVDTLEGAGRSGRYAAGFRRGGDLPESADMALARALAAGAAVDAERCFGPARPAPAAAPAYPFTLRPYDVARTSDALNVMRTPADRGLLGWRAAADEGAWRLTLDAASPAWLADHVVDGAPALPAAAFVELALAAAAEDLGDGPLELRDFDILRPLPLDGARADLRALRDAESGAVRVDGRAFLSDDPFAPHARGIVRAAAGPAPPPRAPLAPAAAADAGLYAALAAQGLAYGPAFARCGRPERAGDGLRAALTPSAVDAAGPFLLDPTALDAAFHLLAPLLADAGAAEPGVAFLPARVGRLVLRRPGAAVAAAEARLTRRGARGVEAAFVLTAADGAVIAEVAGMRFAAVRLTRRAQPEAAFWREAPTPVRLDPAQPAAFGVDWARPAARLAALGVGTDAPPDPDAAQLILDALCRRAAWDLARRLAPRGGVRLGARRALSGGMAGALALGLDALAAEGAYDPEADALIEGAAPPEAVALIDAFAAAASGAAPRLAAAMTVAAAFEGREAPPRAREADDPALWRAAAAAARAMLAALPAGAPADALLAGPAPADVAEGLRAAGASRVAQTAGEAAGVDGPFDLILTDAADPAALRRLAGMLAPGGALARPARARGLADAMLAAMAGRGDVDPADRAGADLEAVGLEGAGAVWIEGVAVALGRKAAGAAGTAGTAPPPAARGGAVAILADARGAGLAMAVALQEALAAAGRTARIVADAAAVAPDEDAVLLLRAAGRDGADPEALAARHAALRALILRPDRTGSVALAGLTANGAPRPVDAALARMARVLANERPGTPVRVLWTEAAGPADAGVRLAQALAAAASEPEIAIDARGRARAPRVLPAPAIARRAALAALGDDAGLALGAAAPGLDGLHWAPAARRAPGPGEVEVAVAAAGLNFRDVMWAMGALPEEAIEDGFAGTRFGMECAGVVTRVGPGAPLREGDRVMGFAAGAFATHVTARADWMAPIPAALGFAEAASLPVAVATAWRGLADLGALAPGETALIHGAAGGVGLAALQIARARGARAFATAGTPARRLLARLFGAEDAFDSRSLDFAEAVMAATAGRGVDVALNSLSGEAMERTLGCVAPFGRFVELGKRDYYAGTRVGLRPMRRNLAYFGVDLDAMLAARPASAAPLLAALAEGLEAGTFAPLPHQLFAAEDAVAAFRLMQRAGHAGKVAIAPPDAPAPVAAPAPLARPDGAWLITGGARGFGLAFAERLARAGAGAIWLTSRTGAGDEAGLARLRAAAPGTRVEVVACDAADEAATAALIDRIGREGPRLTGVAHAAMVLDDALFAEATPERVAASARPKIAGAAILDRLTRGLSLDHFLLFSSVAALFGNPGQTAYVAANAGMEAVAAARRAAGLPALAVRWGPIADAGVLAGDAAARALLARRGAGLMATDEAFAALDTALAGAETADATLTLAPMRWSALAGELRVLSGPLFAQAGVTRETAAGASSLREAVAGLDAPAALKLVVETFRAEAAAILRQAPEEIDPDRPLGEMGFDSLMGMELKLSAEERHGVSLPVFSLSEGATLAALAARVLADLRGEGRQDGDAGADADDRLGAFAARHMSPEQAAALVRADGGKAGP
jgi:acyl transferase domain-containing protein/NADPH:quinone reductase-like Zn-dependent oxidoreductase/NADP-dependent 3-hydroxy acid dehydrogenase YdfG